MNVCLTAYAEILRKPGNPLGGKSTLTDWGDVNVIVRQVIGITGLKVAR